MSIHDKGEVRLVHAVITRAFLDLFSRVSLTSSSDEGRNIREDALQFLTASTGPWRARREELCAMAGHDAGKLRANVIAILEGADPDMGDDRRPLNAVEKARELWVQQGQIAQRQSQERKAVAERRRKEREAVAETCRPEREREVAEEKRRPSPKRGAKRRAKLSVSDVVDALEDGPLTIREVNFKLCNPAAVGTIAERLEEGQRQGLVRRDGPRWFKETLGLSRTSYGRAKSAV